MSEVRERSDAPEIRCRQRESMEDAKAGERGDDDYIRHKGITNCNLQTNRVFENFGSLEPNPKPNRNNSVGSVRFRI